jgi:prepilin-type processing-associated H-X9-DG protein
LIELLVVIAIILILLAIVLPAVMRSRAVARRALCQAQLKNIATALQTYANEYGGHYPCGGRYEEVYKPCPENLLNRQITDTQAVFFCPEDRALTYDEAVEEYKDGGWVARQFRLQKDSPETRYVRAMFRYDRPPVDRMESSYIWCEHIVGDRERAWTHSRVHSPATVGILSEGRHVVNRWTWASLNDHEDCRIDQKHVDETVNMLYADGHVVSEPIGDVDDVDCDPGETDSSSSGPDVP